MALKDQGSLTLPRAFFKFIIYKDSAGQQRNKGKSDYLPFFFFFQTLKDSSVESRCPAAAASCWAGWMQLPHLTLTARCGRWQGSDPRQWHICPEESAGCWGWFSAFWPLPGSWTSALSECEWAQPALSGDISPPLGAGAKNCAKCRAGSTTHPSHHPARLGIVPEEIIPWWEWVSMHLT